MEQEEEEEEGSQPPQLPCPRWDVSPCRPKAGAMAILFGFRFAEGEENPAGQGQEMEWLRTMGVPGCRLA